MVPLLSAWLLGLVLGARHAFEPDHLAAMATMLSTQRSAARTAFIGALWGTGHAVTLFLVGALLIACRLRMPPSLAAAFEACVALLLLVLGVRLLMAGARHRHGHVEEADDGHGEKADHVHIGAWTVARRPFLVGIAHGLAGSGALTALALAAMPSVGSALVYLLMFGLGSVMAMGLASGVLGWPLVRATRTGSAQAAVSSLAGVLSLATGLLWGWRSLFG